MSRHPVDVHVGDRIRNRRWLRGLTQQQLAEAVGIKFQQIQKYESGANRVSASRLWDIAKTLGVPPGWFFEGIEDGAPPPASPPPPDAQLSRLAGRIARLPGDQRAALSGLVTAMERAPAAAGPNGAQG